MEFLMAEALEKKCDHVITTGGINSNHCRTVAIVSRQLGFQPHLLLRVDKKVINYSFLYCTTIICLFSSKFHVNLFYKAHCLKPHTNNYNYTTCIVNLFHVINYRPSHMEN